MIEVARSILSLVAIGVSILAYSTHNMSDAIYLGVMAIWVRPEK